MRRVQRQDDRRGRYDRASSAAGEGPEVVLRAGPELGVHGVDGGDLGPGRTGIQVDDVELLDLHADGEGLGHRGPASLHQLVVEGGEGRVGELTDAQPLGRVGDAVGVEQVLDPGHVGRLGARDVLEGPKAPHVAEGHVHVVGELLLLDHVEQPRPLVVAQDGGRAGVDDAPGPTGHRQGGGRRVGGGRRGGGPGPPISGAAAGDDPEAESCGQGDGSDAAGPGVVSSGCGHRGPPFRCGPLIPPWV